MGRRLGLLAVLGLAIAGLLAVVASAQAAPVLDMKARWGDQVLRPGSHGLFILRVRNYGDEATSGPVTVTEELPPGVTRIEPTAFDSMFGLYEGYGWECEGTSTVTCTTEKPIEAFDNTIPRSIAWSHGGGSGAEGAPGYAPQIYIRVAVDPAAGGQHVNVARVSGGGSAPARDEDPLEIGSRPTPFGFTPGNSEADVFDAAYPAGAPVRQAASHPYELRVNFDFNLQAGEIPSELPGLISDMAYSRPVNNVDTVKAILPKGLIGNPEATPKCKPADFLRGGSSQYTSTACAPETQVGTITLMLNDFSNSTFQHGDSGLFSPASWTRIPVYNLEPPRGYPADFGFDAGDYRGHIYATPDPAHGYAIESLTPYISSLLPVRAAEFTMWGVPADPAHNPLRATVPAQGGTDLNAFGAPSTAPIKPLLTLPASCGDHGKFILEANNYTRQDRWVATDLLNQPLDVGGCGDPRIKFHPEVALQPTSKTAGGPTGLQVNLKVPQRDDSVVEAQELYAQSGDIQAIATPPVKKVVVTMPEGMTISTSAAQGLGNCAPDQIKLGTNAPVTCPESSQYGTLTLRTPILPKDAPMTGKIYVAKQNDNPFHNFLSLYLVVQDPGRGLLVKIPGKVDLDPVTGQITTTFDDLPEFPVSDMEMNLKGGVRAALANPSTCGQKTIRAEFYSWANPSAPVVRTSSYEVGGPCVNDLRDRPFAPQMSAGTVNPAAGAYSPFVYRTTRSDDDQELDGLDVKLPKGLLAKIAGLSKCSDAAIAQAEAPGRTGTEERDHPSCPASSEIGSTEVGSGVGQVLTYVPGKAYLAAPYKGAPLSMVVITPILAGPYDLGVIAVRSKIDVDPISTQATVTTDPLPQIFKGIPVRIRDVRVKVDRPQTTLNPTNCTATEVASRLASTLGARADLSVRFQAADCAALPFKPNLRFKLKGGTHRGDYPALTATLRARPGDANIARTAVTLPHSEFLAQEHIRTVCTRVQYAANQCPQGSIYGYARATSPLFDGALQGPVYLRSSSNPLPDLVAKLDGEIDVELSGRIDSVHQGIRNTFDVVPDAPVDTFTLWMQGGKKGLLVNSRNLCKQAKRNRADVRMTGQNGKRHKAKPRVVATACKKKKRKRAKHKRAQGPGGAKHRR